MINDIIPSNENLVYMFKFDSTYGKFPGKVEYHDNSIIINGKKTIICHEENIKKISWNNFNIDVLIDSSGIDENLIAAKDLISSGYIKKYIFTMSSDNAENEIIVGVNDKSLKSNHNVISGSICDANAIAHILPIIDKEYLIESGSVTTLHPWLSYQNLMDGAMKGIAPDPNKFTPAHISNNFGLARSSISNLIPKNTTAVTAVEKVLSGLKGKLLSHSFRIPTSTVSCADIILKTRKTQSINELSDLLIKEVRTNAYVRLNYEPLISSDYEMEEASAVIDMQWLKVNNGLIKIVLWYDNEWGYSSRIIDLVRKLKY
jgi:glyceraldehyde 3-phosphate dehydrogenase